MAAAVESLAFWMAQLTVGLDKTVGGTEVRDIVSLHTFKKTLYGSAGWEQGHRHPERLLTLVRHLQSSIQDGRPARPAGRLCPASRFTAGTVFKAVAKLETENRDDEGGRA